MVSLNSEESFAPGSPQMQWLEQDLARYEGSCTIAYWHKPRYSAQSWDVAGEPNNDRSEYEQAWAALAGRAVAVLNAHDHSYQRMAPMRGGVTQFVVGTGGHSWYPVNDGDARLEAWFDNRSGIPAAALRMDLGDNGTASYQLVENDGDVRDSGSLACTPVRLRGTPAPGPGPRPQPGGSSTVTPLSVRFRTPSLAAFRRRGLRAGIGCATPCSGTVALVAGPRAARQLGIRRPRLIRLHTVRVTGPGVVRLRLPLVLARRAARLRRLRLSVQVVGSSGGGPATRVSRALRLTR